MEFVRTATVIELFLQERKRVIGLLLRESRKKCVGLSLRDSGRGSNF